jgi:hypothetical protein
MFLRQYCVYFRPLLFIPSSGNTHVVQLPTTADGKVRHPDRMSQESRDEQRRTSREWKNCPLTSNKNVAFFHHRFSDLGGEQKTFQQRKLNADVPIRHGKGIPGRDI